MAQNITAYNFNFYLSGNRIPGDFTIKKTELFLKDQLVVMDIDEVLSSESQILHDRLLWEAGIILSQDTTPESIKQTHPDNSAIMYYKYDYMRGGK